MTLQTGRDDLGGVEYQEVATAQNLPEISDVMVMALSGSFIDEQKSRGVPWFTGALRHQFTGVRIIQVVDMHGGVFATSLGVQPEISVLHCGGHGEHAGMAKKLSIEQCFAAVEKAIADLEDGELPLETSLSVYEAGLKSVRQARTHLDAFAKRLEALRQLEEDALADDDAAEE